MNRLEIRNWLSSLSEEALNELEPMATLYEDDFYDWTNKTAAAIRNKEFADIDWDNVAEEIESLGRNDRDKLISSLKILIAHLLKYEYQPEEYTKSWTDTISRERENILEYLEDMPSLAQFLHSEEWMAKAYIRGKRIAVKETKLPEKTFPDSCPYAIEQLRDFDYLP